MALTGVVTKVETSDDAAIVDLHLVYAVAGRQYACMTTRTDNLRVSYQTGMAIDLLCQTDNPANVMDASLRPWDDVIGPVVLGVLLLLCMGWLWLVLVGLR